LLHKFNYMRSRQFYLRS